MYIHLISFIISCPYTSPLVREILFHSWIAGVRSFAAFVASSKNLLLLWSPFPDVLMAYVERVFSCWLEWGETRIGSVSCTHVFVWNYASHCRWCFHIFLISLFFFSPILWEMFNLIQVWFSDGSTTNYNIGMFASYLCVCLCVFFD